MSYLKSKQNSLNYQTEPTRENRTEPNGPMETEPTNRALASNIARFSSKLEQELTSEYESQTTRYANALYTANQIATKLSSGESADDLQEQLGELMESIAAADQEIAPKRQQWDASGRTANLELRRSVERLRSTIEKVISAVAAAENIALEAKQRLEPHLGSAMSAQRMMAAYNAAKTKSE